MDDPREEVAADLVGPEEVIRGAALHPRRGRQPVADVHGEGVVRGDGAASFERVANVLSVCKQSGIADLAIAVETAGAESKNARR